MFSQKYDPLNQSSDSVDDDNNVPWSNDAKLAVRRARRVVFGSLVVLSLSILFNVLLLAKLNYLRVHQHDPSWFGLERNVGTEIPHDDRTIDDPMWDAPEFDWNVGWVALDNDQAKLGGLPTSMHWPWDESRSIYVLHGFHSLHCVFVLRDSIRAYRDGEEQIWPLSHVTHCLHVLREDTTCNADDTPRYTGKLHAQENSSMIFSGNRQVRQCRDWGQLRQYAIQQSACYHRPLHHHIPLLDRYKHCPDGSTPWE